MFLRYSCALIAFASVAEAMRYKSGAVTGYEKFTYGKFITRMKAPNKKGTVSSFFTYWNGPDFYPGGWNELDVEVVPSVEKNPFSMNIIYGDGQAKHETHQYKEAFDPKDDWHIYEMAWTPDYVAWSIDNKEVRRVKNNDPSIKYLNKGQSVMMNFWTPTFESWGKGFNAADMPWYVLYDYVETYTWNSETSGFDFHWRDDFVTFDAERWHKSDNTTFDANSTTFRAGQSYIKDGHLVLKMEPDLHQGEYLHPGQHYQPTKVVPVESEPAYEHKGAKGEKVKKEDQHYDVLAEQHMSHMAHEHHPVGEEYYHRGAPYEHGYEHRRTPREMAEYGYYEQQAGYNPYEEHYAPSHYYQAMPHHQEALGQEMPDAHLARHHEPMTHAETGPHDATPIHSASTEPHVASRHAYYGGMFHANDEHEVFNAHHEAPVHHTASAVADNLTYHGQTIAHHDTTPYEYHHEATHHEERRDYLPEHQSHREYEDRHDAGHSVDYEHIRALPSYEELLYAYLHDGEHMSQADHGDHVVHGEHKIEGYEAHDHGLGDHAIDYTHQGERELEFVGHEGVVHAHGDEWPAHQPHHESYRHESYDDIHSQAHHQKLNPEHYRRDVYSEHQDGHHATVHDERRYDDHRHESDHHTYDRHEGDAYYRGDHYDDHHKTDEDFRHDTPDHTYHSGDTYKHDVDYHQGTQLMHDIEHEYDELFHEIEAQTKHGVEHHDVEHHMLPFDGEAGLDHRAAHETTAHRYHEAESHHGEDFHEEGPSMYSWAIHEQAEIEPVHAPSEHEHASHHPRRHHESFAEQYYREHHLPHDYNLHEHQDDGTAHVTVDQEVRFEPLGSHHAAGPVHQTVVHRETLIPHTEAPVAHHQTAVHHEAAPVAHLTPAAHHAAPVTHHEAVVAPVHHPQAPIAAHHAAPVHHGAVAPKKTTAAKQPAPSTPAKKSTAQPAVAKKLEYMEHAGMYPVDHYL